MEKVEMQEFGMELSGGFKTGRTGKTGSSVNYHMGNNMNIPVQLVLLVFFRGIFYVVIKL